MVVHRLRVTDAPGDHRRRHGRLQPDLADFAGRAEEGGRLLEPFLLRRAALAPLFPVAAAAALRREGALALLRLLRTEPGVEAAEPFVAVELADVGVGNRLGMVEQALAK